MACLLALGLAVLAAVPLDAAERQALIASPAGMPVRLEAATFFDDGRMLTWVWRNNTRDALYPRVRVFVFDAADRFVGSMSRCSAEPLQAGTRAQVRTALEIEDVTSRHRFVALLEEVRSEETIWRADPGGRVLVDTARRIVRAESAALTAVSEVNTDGKLACGCDCEMADALGREGCGARSLAAFTCTPVFFPGGCTLGYTCRP